MLVIIGKANNMVVVGCNCIIGLQILEIWLEIVYLGGCVFGSSA